MTFKSTDYALLAQESYNDPKPDKKAIVFGDVAYKVFGHADNPKTGFQATAYQRVDTGEVVIAYRGTEFGREPVQDGRVDVVMALSGVNAQMRDAGAFTQKMLDKAKADAQDTGRPLSVTVTGHSLGGTLAQLEAHKFGLKGETFNAFGAAGLVHGAPKGGAQVINHVRAGDVVSAASAHFGQVRVYAIQQDIDTLAKAGYRDNGGALSARNPAKATDFGAHSMDGFVPNSQSLGRSIIAPENQARYQAHQSMIDRYRNDIYAARTVAAVPLQTGIQAGQTAGQAVNHGVKAVGDAAGQVYDATRDKVETGVRRAGEKVEQLRDGASQLIDKAIHLAPRFGSQAVPAALTEPTHPGHSLFRDAQTGMQGIDARYGRSSNTQTDNAAGVVAVASYQAGMSRIDAMELGGAKGDKIIAVQGQPGNAHSKVVDVPTVTALNTPLAQSSQAFAEAQTQRQSQAAQQVTPPAAQQAAPVLA